MAILNLLHKKTILSVFGQLEPFEKSSYFLQAEASFITIEADQVKKGIVDIVNQYGVRRLIIGAVPEK